MLNTTQHSPIQAKLAFLSCVCLFSIPALSANAETKNKQPKLGWTGQVSLSMSSDQGNTNLDRLNLGAIAKYKNNTPLSHLFRASIAQTDTAPNRDADKRTTKDVKRYSYRADYALSDKNLIVGYIGYEEDAKVKLDSEVATMIGFVRQNMGTENHKFMAGVGVGHLEVKYTDGTDKVSGFATRLALGYDGKITDSVGFKTEYILMDTDERTMKRLTSSLAYDITEKASIELEHEISRRNKVADTAVDKKDDTTKLNFVFKF